MLYSGRCIITYKGHLFEDARFANFAKKCYENGVKVITIGASTFFEDYVLFETTEAVENFATEYGINADVSFGRAVDAINHASALVARGQKVVVFVDNVAGLLKEIDSRSTLDQYAFGHRAESVVLLQKILSLGKAYNLGGSVTVIITRRADDEADAFVDEEIMRVSTIIE